MDYCEDHRPNPVVLRILPGTRRPATKPPSTSTTSGYPQFGTAPRSLGDGRRSARCAERSQRQAGGSSPAGGAACPRPNQTAPKEPSTKAVVPPSATAAPSAWVPTLAREFTQTRIMVTRSYERNAPRSRSFWFHGPASPLSPRIAPQVPVSSGISRGSARVDASNPWPANSAAVARITLLVVSMSPRARPGPSRPRRTHPRPGDPAIGVAGGSERTRRVGHEVGRHW